MNPMSDLVVKGVTLIVMLGGAWFIEIVFPSNDLTMLIVLAIILVFAIRFLLPILRALLGWPGEEGASWNGRIEQFVAYMILIFLLTFSMLIVRLIQSVWSHMRMTPWNMTVSILTIGAIMVNLVAFAFSINIETSFAKESASEEKKPSNRA